MLRPRVYDASEAVLVIDGRVIPLGDDAHGGSHYKVDTSVEYGAWVIAPDLLPRIVGGSFADEVGRRMVLLPPLNDLPSVVGPPSEMMTTYQIDRSVPGGTVIDLAVHRHTPGTVWHVSTVQCIACGYQHVATQPMPEWAVAPVNCACPKCGGAHTCLPMREPPERRNDGTATLWKGPEDA